MDDRQCLSGDASCDLAIRVIEPEDDEMLLDWRTFEHALIKPAVFTSCGLTVFFKGVVESRKAVHAVEIDVSPTSVYL